MIRIIGALYGQAGHVLGAEVGARILKQYALGFENVCDGGDVQLPESSKNNGLECLQDVKIICSKLADVLKNYLDSGDIVITMGGDHSIALGTISGAMSSAACKGKEFGVIYIDAHADMNTIDSSPTGNIHGMPLAGLLGVEPLLYIGDKQNRHTLNPDNILLVATRSVDAGEKKIIEEKGITVISSDEILSAERDGNIDSIASKIISFIENRNLQQIHLSLDIDAVDPTEAPGTGVPESNGITERTFRFLINYIMKVSNVRSIDLVEFNPLLDKSNKTEQVIKTIAEEVKDNSMLKIKYCN